MNGSFTTEIPKQQLKDGENTVTIICGNGDGVYNENKKPSAFNHNDPSVKDMLLTVGEEVITPSAVTGYYFTDKDTPASQSHETRNIAYSAGTFYQFGDGKGSAEPKYPSTEVPYKIDFTFQLEGIEEPSAAYSWNLTGGGIYRGRITVEATAVSNVEELNLLVDGTPVSGKENGPAVFSYSSSEIGAHAANQYKDGFYVNGILEDYLDEYQSEIQVSGLNYGTDNIVTLNIGTGSGPYEESKSLKTEGNHDDFKVWDFKLMLPDETVLTPSKVKTFRVNDMNQPAKDGNVTAEESSSYSSETKYDMGDSNTSQFYKVELTFAVPEVNSKKRYFDLDTTYFADGSHTLTLVSGGETKNSADVKFDNQAPEINLNFADGAVLKDGFVVSADISDAVSGVDTATAFLNGQTISLPFDATMDNLGTEPQYLIIRATDKCGNQKELRASFSLKEDGFSAGNAEGQEKDGTYTFQVETDAQANGPLTVQFFGTDIIETRTYSGISTEQNLSELNISGAQAVAGTAGGFITKETSQGLPYNLYEVRVGEKTGTVRFTVNADTINGETLAFVVYNPQTGLWETLSRKKSSGANITFSAEIEAENYAKDGIIRVAVAPFLAGNGSDVLAWITDTQFYTEYPDLRDGEFYLKMTTWLKEQYEAGNISYVAHTGDIVNTRNREDESQLASAVQAVLDDAGVPNGVVSGNHDVGSSLSDLDYTLYKKYFGASRYMGTEWYGGSFDNNTNHYDLITVGGNDMIILYLGMGKEATDETVAWANEVLQKYSHRTAIIALHQYLDANGTLLSASRATDIIQKIIRPNENVSMVICGHMHAEAKRLNLIENSGRIVVEILADYQGENNGGDGFLRLMTFQNGKMINRTYSPITGEENILGAQEAFSVPVQMIQNRRLVSSGNLSAVFKEEKSAFATVEVTAGETAAATMNSADVNFAGWYAVVSDAAGKSMQTAAVPVEITNIPVGPVNPGDPSVPVTPGGWEKPSEPGQPSEPDTSTETKEEYVSETLKAMENVQMVARSRIVTMKNGKKAVKVTWYDAAGTKMDFDGVEIFRSTKKHSGYGKKPIFTTTGDAYYNTDIKSGTRYYYKVRGFVKIDGKKYYTEYSLKAIRTA
ncbi:MAG: metallophosphoesterase [Anaerovoracaceae bacterium]